MTNLGIFLDQGGDPSNPTTPYYSLRAPPGPQILQTDSYFYKWNSNGPPLVQKDNTIGSQRLSETRPIGAWFMKAMETCG
jgi:hypothetical protein